MDQSRYKRQIYTRTGEMKATSQEGHFSLLRAALASWPRSSLILSQHTGQFFRLHIPSFLCQKRTFHQFSSSLIPSATSNYIVYATSNIKEQNMKIILNIQHFWLIKLLFPVCKTTQTVIFMFEFMSGRAMLYSPILENVMCSQVLKY